MNDILSRFLVVTDSEVDSYWMFCNYMYIKRHDFIEETMMNKICMFMYNQCPHLFMYLVPCSAGTNVTERNG